MEEPKSFNEIYANTIAKVGQELFCDYLSEFSRKRQASLLISSIVTILLALSIVEPQNTEFLGVKFKFTDVSLIPLLFGFISLYFGITYIISFSQDWQQAKYRRETVPVELEKINNELEKAKVDHENQLKLLEEKYEVAVQRFFEFSKARQIKRDQEYEEYKEKMKALDDLPRGERWKALPNLPDIDVAKDLEELRRAAPLTLKKEYLAVKYDNSLSIKSEYLQQIQPNYQKLKFINFIVEILFPTILGLVAFISTIWAAFIK